LKVHGNSLESLVRAIASGMILAASMASAQNIPLADGYIYTVDGDGSPGFSGDGELAIDAELNQPSDVVLDLAGNLYIADYFNSRVRKVDVQTGNITTVAGNGVFGYSGDGGPATSAEFDGPLAITLDSAGNIYVADYGNQRIRKVDVATGIITTVAGNGIVGFSGDGGLATNAELYSPAFVLFDADGDFYISDQDSNCIRKVNVTTGIITTIAGSGNPNGGYRGDGGSATDAELWGPSALALDASGNLYIADTFNNRVRRIRATTGIITTIAGNGSEGYSGDGGLATNAEFYRIVGLSIDPAGNLYIGDALNFRVRAIEAGSNLVNTIAGDGFAGFSGDNGRATSAEISFSYGLTNDLEGNLYIADSSNNRIRIVRPESLVPTTTTLTAMPVSITVSETVTLTATVTAASGGTPAGTVTFYNGTVPLGSASLNGSGVAILTLTPALGNYSITASYGGNLVDAPSQSAPPVSVTVNAISPENFSITAGPGSQTVYTGEAASYAITITTNADFNLPVVLSCSQLPANTTCSFSPPSVTGGGSSTLVVRTSPPSQGGSISPLPSGLRIPLLAGLLMLFVPRHVRCYRKGWQLLIVFLALLAAGPVITACSTPGQLAGATPLGPQTITVAGTATYGSQSLTQTTTMTLNVKSLF
jgi:sugar lactone lactonase YvrE